MQKIQFKEPAARKIYENYLSSVENATQHLSKEDQQEILMEINSHLYEALQQESGETEVEKLVKITTELGDPHVTLKPAIAARKLNKAVRTFNPQLLFSALYISAKNSVKYACFFVLYLLIASMLSLIFFKIFYPDNTGLFYADNRVSAFGFILDTSGKTEVMHGWFYPIVLAIVALLYIVLTLILRLTRKNVSA
jgi:hypothetical protein